MDERNVYNSDIQSHLTGINHQIIGNDDIRKPTVYFKCKHYHACSRAITSKKCWNKLSPSGQSKVKMTCLVMASAHSKILSYLTQLHQGPAVRRKDHAHPVEGVGGASAEHTFAVLPSLSSNCARNLTHSMIPYHDDAFPRGISRSASSGNMLEKYFDL